MLADAGAEHADRSRHGANVKAACLPMKLVCGSLVGSGGELLVQHEGESWSVYRVSLYVVVVQRRPVDKPVRRTSGLPLVYL